MVPTDILLFLCHSNTLKINHLLQPLRHPASSAPTPRENHPFFQTAEKLTVKDLIFIWTRSTTLLISAILPITKTAVMPNNTPQSIDELIDNIASNIQKGKVIPIVGYEMLINPFSTPERDKDFLRDLIKIHAKAPDLEVKYPRAKTSGDLINEFYHDLDETKRDSFKLKISETIQRERINHRLIPDSYRKLVSIRCIQLFINATITNSLELAMNRFRGEGQYGTSVKSSYSVLSYDPNHPDDLPIPAPVRNFRVEFKKPIIYNLFGTHDEEKGDYVLTDADHIELIYDLFLYEKEKFSNLLSFLNQGDLLFLGCNFPDWFFRFLIRVCVGDRLDRLDKILTIKRNTVIDTLKLVDNSRTIFIDQYGIRELDMDCNLLVDKLYDAMKERNCIPAQRQSNNHVFISHCRADTEFAKKVAKQLAEKFIEYFLDIRDLEVGDDLGSVIQEEIDRCCLFIPIVSGNIQSSSPYLWREWNYAVNSCERIWPIYKEFVDPKMLAPTSFAISDQVRKRILDRDNTLGIAPNGDEIPLTDLIKIKELQYISSVSGTKNHLATTTS
jgi:hypothetical protein